MAHTAHTHEPPLAINGNRCPRCSAVLVGADGARCGIIYCWHCGHKIGRDLVLRRALILFDVALVLLGAAVGMIVHRLWLQIRRSGG
jgi:hypothetical protein